MSAVVESDNMALKATLEPMLIRDKTIVYRHVNITEFTGAWNER